MGDFLDEVTEDAISFVTSATYATLTNPSSNFRFLAFPEISKYSFSLHFVDMPTNLWYTISIIHNARKTMKLGNVLILGDSYSTFEGQIPEGYACYYTKTPRPETDVRKVEQTWWYPLLQETGANLLLNSSYSGSTICNTGYDRADFTDRSFISRLDKLIENGFFEKNTVDTLLIFGGTNDTWAGSPVGEMQYENWSKSDLFAALPAICYLFHRVKTATNVKKTYAILNTELSETIENALLKAATRYGVSCIRLENIDKNGGHPTIKGMADIKNEILAKL